MRTSLTLTFLSAVALAACNNDETNAADNAIRSDREPTTQAPAALDTTAAQTDRRIADEIRAAIGAKTELSLNAQSVSVTCANGVVTLRGSVDSTAERDSLGSIAAGIAGVARVDNQLEVR